MSYEFEETTEIIVFEEIKAIKKVLLMMSVEDTPYCRRFERTHESIPACNYALNDYLIQYFFAVEKDTNFSIDFNNIDASDLYDRMDLIINKFNPGYIILHTGIAYLTNPDLFGKVFTLMRKNYPLIIYGIEDINLSNSPGFTFDDGYEIAYLIEIIFPKYISFEYKVSEAKCLTEIHKDLTVMHRDYEVLKPYNINRLFYRESLDYYISSLQIGVSYLPKQLSEVNVAFEKGNIEQLARIFHSLSVTVRYFDETSSISRMIYELQFETQKIINTEYKNRVSKQIIPYLEVLIDEIRQEIDSCLSEIKL